MKNSNVSSDRREQSVLSKGKARDALLVENEYYAELNYKRSSYANSMEYCKRMIKTIDDAMGTMLDAKIKGIK